MERGCWIIIVDNWDCKYTSCYSLYLNNKKILKGLELDINNLFLEPYSVKDSK